VSGEEKRYVVMTRAGNIRRFSGGLSSGTESLGPYLSILDGIYIEFQSAGGNWDRPDKLFLNGKIVVESGLADLAWKYAQDRAAATQAAVNAVRNIHIQDWAPDDEQKPGFNPPGVDVWEVRKVRP
jgi:hypothetical protein